MQPFEKQLNLLHVLVYDAERWEREREETTNEAWTLLSWPRIDLIRCSNKIKQETPYKLSSWALRIRLAQLLRTSEEGEEKIYQNGQPQQACW